jgi:hypothetical protein
MAQKQLNITAPDLDFDLAVQALAFNGGAALSVGVEEATPLALTRLRKYLRDELAAYGQAQLNAQQQAQRDAFIASQEAALDQKAETLVLEIVDL